MNSHDLLELKFDISDATLQGSADFIQKMPEVVSRYQLRFDFNLVQENAMKNCTATESCASIINESKIGIVEGIAAFMMSDYYDTPAEVQN
jgi:hypothetical protein